MALQWLLESTLEFLGSLDYWLKISFVVDASENPWSFAVLDFWMFSFQCHPLSTRSASRLLGDPDAALRYSVARTMRHLAASLAAQKTALGALLKGAGHVPRRVEEQSRFELKEKNGLRTL